MCAPPSWEAPFATPLLNPNSKVFVSALPTSGDLVVTFNPSTTSRTPLQLSISEDSSATWNKFVVVLALCLSLRSAHSRK